MMKAAFNRVRSNELLDGGSWQQELAERLRGSPVNYLKSHFSNVTIKVLLPAAHLPLRRAADHIPNYL
jgi:hypothetical protein